MSALYLEGTRRPQVVLPGLRPPPEGRARVAPAVQRVRLLEPLARRERDGLRVVPLGVRPPRQALVRQCPVADQLEAAVPGPLQALGRVEVREGGRERLQVQAGGPAALVPQRGVLLVEGDEAAEEALCLGQLAVGVCLDGGALQGLELLRRIGSARGRPGEWPGGNRCQDSR